MTYDAENRQTSAHDSVTNGTETYFYDGLGQRIEKAGPSGAKVYVYDALGQLAAEYWTTASTPACTTCYLSYDHLGTPRLVTDSSGIVIARHDYLPFGEEATVGRNSQWGAGNDDISQKFTGYERDTETGLDFAQARYYGSALGRFMSPDPMNAGVDLTNPQSWNAYAYVLGNPLNGVDPTGMSLCTPTGESIACVQNDGPGTPEENYQMLGYGQGGPLFYSFGIPTANPSSANVPTANSPSDGTPPKSWITMIGQKFCSAIPDARTLTLSGGIGAVGSTQGSFQASLDYRTGLTSFSASGGFQFGWNGVASAQLSMGFVYGSSSSNRSVSYSGGTAVSGYMSTSGNSREYGVGIGVSLTEGVGGGRTVSLSTPSVGNVPGLESPLDSLLVVAKQVCR